MTALAMNPPDVLSPQSRKSFPESDVTMDGGHGEERARSVYQKGKEKALQAEEHFENYVRAHPVKSVLIATGVGLAFGVLLGRKR